MNRKLIHLSTEEKSKIKTNTLTILIGLIFIFLIWYSDRLSEGVAMLASVFLPFILGFVISYILVRPKEFIENLLIKLKVKKYAKGLAILGSYVLLFTVISTFFGIVFPQIIASARVLADSITIFLRELSIDLGEFSTYGIGEEALNELSLIWQDVLMYAGNLLVDLVPNVLSLVNSFTSMIINLVISLVVSVYMLIEKDKIKVQIKRFIYAFIPEKVSDKIVSTGVMANDIFGKFIVGQLTVAFLLGIMCFISMTVMGMNYAMLISVIIGFTNLIPYFGPFIGAIPSTFILFTENITHAGMFVVLVIVLQQIDNNLISPKIVGENIGLSGLWVIFAITVGGAFMGLPGMIIGTPTFAVIYNLFGELVEYRIKANNIRKEKLTEN